MLEEVLSPIALGDLQTLAAGHEAGHAVVAAALGYRAYAYMAAPDPMCLVTGEQVRDRPLICAGGEVGACLACCPNASLGNEADVENAGHALAALTGDPAFPDRIWSDPTIWDRLTREAWQILVMHKSRFEQVMRKLREHGEAEVLPDPRRPRQRTLWPPTAW